MKKEKGFGWKKGLVYLRAHELCAICSPRIKEPNFNNYGTMKACMITLRFTDFKSWVASYPYNLKIDYDIINLNPVNPDKPLKNCT